MLAKESSDLSTPNRKSGIEKRNNNKPFGIVAKNEAWRGNEK